VRDLNLLTGSVADQRLEESFIIIGMNNWKHALDKFASHEKTACHRFAAVQLEQYKRKDSVSVQLDKRDAADKAVSQ